MKIERKDEDSDPITYSSIWWIPGWIYLISGLPGTIEYGVMWGFYLVTSFLSWLFYFFKFKK